MGEKKPAAKKKALKAVTLKEAATKSVKGSQKIATVASNSRGKDNPKKNQKIVKTGQKVATVPVASKKRSKDNAKESKKRKVGSADSSEKSNITKSRERRVRRKERNVEES